MQPSLQPDSWISIGPHFFLLTMFPWKSTLILFCHERHYFLILVAFCE